MQRQGQLPVDGQFVDRRLLGRFDHGVRHTIFSSLCNHCRVVGIKEDFQLFFVQVLLGLGAGHFVDAVGVIEQYAQVADAAHAGFRTDRGLARFNTRVAEDAFL